MRIFLLIISATLFFVAFVDLYDTFQQHGYRAHVLVEEFQLLLNSSDQDAYYFVESWTEMQLVKMRVVMYLFFATAFGVIGYVWKPRKKAEKKEESVEA